MKTKTFLVFALIVTLLALGCKDTKKEEAELNQKLGEIEEVEKTLDSTVNEVHKKAQAVEELIKDLDSI